MKFAEIGPSPYIFLKGDMNRDVAAWPDISGFVKDLIRFIKTMD